ncbi:MAG: hypothetical protein MJ189_02140 [Coriobacteriales bacterium]|nr:hypothetical protein [Coriobacteriales bacterium]
MGEPLGQSKDLSFYNWVKQNLEYDELKFKEDQLCALSCGLNTYTWFVEKGVLFTTVQLNDSQGELASNILRQGDMIHSMCEDTMISFRCLTSVSLIRIESKPFNKAIKDNPDLSWQLNKYYCDLYTLTLQNYKYAVLDSTENRLEQIDKQLSNLSELKNKHVSDSVLAAFLGMHRVSVCRIRNKLNKKQQTDQAKDLAMAIGAKKIND